MTHYQQLAKSVSWPVTYHISQETVPTNQITFFMSPGQAV